MRLTINFKDDILDTLEVVAKRQGKSVEKLLTDLLPLLATYNPNDNNIVLSGKDVSDLSDAVGGKTLRNGRDIVKLVQQCFTVNVDGAEFKMNIEDLNTLKEQYMGNESFMTFQEYLTQFLEDAVSLHLNGFIQPRVAYK